MTDIPHNLDFEHALLAHILRDNTVLDSLHRIEPRHFYDAQLREVFTSALDLRRDSEVVDLVTLWKLTASDPLGGATVADRLRAVSFDAVPRPQDLADALITLAHRRSLQGLCVTVAESVANPAAKPAAIAEVVMRECERLLADAQPAGQTYWAPPEAMNEALDRLGRNNPADRLMTGIAALDKQAGGLHRKLTVYLAARPSVGKSATAIAIAVNVAKAGHGVLYVSLEMTLEQIEARIASAETYSSGKPLPYDRALNRQLSDDERERFIRAGLARNLLPIAIEERPSLSTTEIAARVRKTAQEFANKGQRLGLVIIDLLGKVKPRDLRAPLVQQLGEISKELAALAKSENIAMLVLHQLNRGVEGRENKRPLMSDLRDSGNLEQDADNVWLLYRPAYYLARGDDEETPAQKNERKLELENKAHVLEIDVAKNRNGAIGTVDAFCDLAFNVIIDVDKRHAR